MSEGKSFHIQSTSVRTGTTSNSVGSLMAGTNRQCCCCCDSKLEVFSNVMHYINLRFTLLHLNYYPAGPEINKTLLQQSNSCTSESSALKNDVYIWRYALIVTNARNE